MIDAIIFDIDGTLWDATKEIQTSWNKALKEIVGIDRFPIFIISNCQSGYIEAFLENTGLEPWIQDFTCPGYTGKEKGDNILIMMKRHSLKRPAYVGDTVGDMQASDFANVPFIYASYGYGQIQNPRFYISRFSDLEELDYENM